MFFLLLVNHPKANQPIEINAVEHEHRMSNLKTTNAQSSNVESSQRISDTRCIRYLGSQVFSGEFGVNINFKNTTIFEHAN